MSEDTVSPGHCLDVLRKLVQSGAITVVRHTVFRYEPYGESSTVADVKECFVTLCEHIGARKVAPKAEWRSVSSTVLDFWVNETLFEKLFDQLYVKQKLYPVTRPDSGPGPLPSLFIGSEKTQVRQIPLADERPWPFKFLLELGGMIVCKTEDKRDLLLELRQYMNNFPHFRMRVHAEQWPTGEILVVTTWFQVLEKREGRANVNVPDK